MEMAIAGFEYWYLVIPKIQFFLMLAISDYCSCHQFANCVPNIFLVKINFKRLVFFEKRLIIFS